MSLPWKAGGAMSQLRSSEGIHKKNDEFGFEKAKYGPSRSIHTEASV